MNFTGIPRFLVPVNRRRNSVRGSHRESASLVFSFAVTPFATAAAAAASCDVEGSLASDGVLAAWAASTPSRRKLASMTCCSWFSKGRMVSPCSLVNESSSLSAVVGGGGGGGGGANL